MRRKEKRKKTMLIMTVTTKPLIIFFPDLRQLLFQDSTIIYFHYKIYLFVALAKLKILDVF